MKRPDRSSRAALAALLSGFLLGNASGGCMDGGELQCEEAVARLAECCGVGDLSSVSCTHTQSSCGETFPDVGVDDARCIRGATCGELESRGACAWARAAASGPPGSLTGVCP